MVCDTFTTLYEVAKINKKQHETDVPAHLSAERRHPATVLQLGRRQHPAPHLHHVVADSETEFLYVCIIVEVRAAHQVVDFPLAIGSRPNRIQG